MLTDRTEPLAFIGWFKPKGGRWRKVCDSATRSDCWQQLLALLPGLSKSGGESMVRPSQAGPPTPKER